MLGLYLLGIVVAVITARLMRRYLFKKDETPFVMELPPYRVPTMRATLSHMWDRCAQYLRKMGGLILIASVAVWFLSYYPTPDAAAPAETMEEHYENSYLGQVGQACSPVFEPLGLNWKASIAILTACRPKRSSSARSACSIRNRATPRKPNSTLRPSPSGWSQAGISPGIGPRLSGLHPALPAMYRHDRSDRRRDRLALGLYFGTLQYGFGMDNGLSDVSPFLLVII